MSLEKLSPIKTILLRSKRPINDQLKKEVIWNYISYKLKKRYIKNGNIDQRGIELKYNWIAKHTGLTYRQVRYLMDRMVSAGVIEKWSVWENPKCRRNFYRLKEVN